MDKYDLGSLVPQWRTGKDRDGNPLHPKVAEGMAIAAAELEAMIKMRYTIGTDVICKESGRKGEIVGAIRRSRRHPIVYVVALVGGGSDYRMRDELEQVIHDEPVLDRDPVTAEAMARMRDLADT